MESDPCVNLQLDSFHFVDVVFYRTGNEYLLALISDMPCVALTRVYLKF
jgi:hypothetical protein